MSIQTEQLEVAKLLLNALREDQFAIAGGVAVRLNGFVARPTEDLDMFTNRMNVNIAEVAAQAVSFLISHGYAAEVDTAVTSEQFGRILTTTPSGSQLKIELGHDWREHPTISSEWGPVIHPSDSAASKLAAFWARREPRDAIDVAGIIESNFLSTEAALQLLGEQDAGFSIETFLPALRTAANYSDQQFGTYEISASEAHRIREFFNSWLSQLESE